MYFCPNCNYAFDITKLSSTTTAPSKKQINDIAEVFKLLKNNEDLSKYSATFDKKEIIKTSKYSKLLPKKKDMINLLFEELNFSGIIFKCLNCNNVSKIKETIRLYEYNLKENTDITTNKDQNKLTCLNPIYPRTKDYTCKNINCISHKELSKKEAIYYKSKDNYQLTYICCSCYTNWDLN